MSTPANEPMAWMNGEYKLIRETALHVFDRGVVHGASVTEMLRTFRHQPFRVDQHLERFWESMDAVMESPAAISIKELQGLIGVLVSHNAKFIPDSHDLGIIVFLTAGTNLTYVGKRGVHSGSTICVHTFPLPFELWAEKMTTGQRLVIPSVRAIPPECIDPRIKHRSRLHWTLADKEARSLEPSASALVLDLSGRVTETSSGNFFLVRDGEIQTPPPSRCLGGISQAVVKQLAGELEIPYRETDLTVTDLEQASEAFVSSTPYCILPVQSLDGKELKQPIPGSIFQKLIAAWNALVGVDIIEQIQTGSKERTEEEI